MNTEAVAEMIEAYRKQAELIDNLDFIINGHPQSPNLINILEKRRKDFQEEQKSLFEMLSAEYTESIKIEEFISDCHKYMTVEPPSGFG